MIASRHYRSIRQCAALGAVHTKFLLPWAAQRFQDGLAGAGQDPCSPSTTGLRPGLPTDPSQPGAVLLLGQHLGLDIRTFVTDTGIVKGSEFVRKIQKLGRKHGVAVKWVPARGKGSHGLLYFGSRLTTVRNIKDEMDKGAFHRMLRQLDLTAKDLE